ncbi:MAG: segregation ATPase FtsK/SpoIIIE, family [Gaiellaceae bacterium]|jgi:S-DNA-T family DNA segregation ATPase FtsK/SpoIIIE|nr:segregation ATPase FtsK/SpoIIIE, family [Gaiellaceae bacterium]MDX6506396.1 segregation ATPase FtsK/SpoIIIE, family [Gaiellaceae bacterium]
MARRRKRRTLKPRVPSRVKRRKRGGKQKAEGHQHPELIGLGLLALGAFLGSVVWAGWNGGYVGHWIGQGLEALIGSATIGLPAALAIVGALMVARSDLVDVRPFRTGLVVLALGLMITLGKDQGGYVGTALGGGLALAIGSTGVAIAGILTLLAGGLLVTGASAGAMVRSSGRSLRVLGTRTIESTRRRRAPVQRLQVLDGAITAESLPPVAPPVDVVNAFPELVSEGDSPLLIHPETEAEDQDQSSLFDITSETATEYRLPDRALLRRSAPGAGPDADHSSRVAEALVQTLANFGVEATVIGQISGPRVTRYELQLAPGTKVSKVAGLKDDLSYALATTEIRILAPIPGKQAVGVELPNTSPNLVTLGDIYDDLPVTSSPLSVWLGKDISGQAVWTDLARMPHILIAGTTGSGKSGCINTILTSVLLRSTPEDVRMILIDPKRIELNYYESIPHLLTPVVSSPKEAATVLRNVVAEMERRYERLSAVRARSLSEANRAFRSRGEPSLPYLLVVIDELADLMMISPQEVEDAVIRLAQKSRAVGIHLVLATQRPSVDVITGMIKANVPSRIAFAVSSQTDSRVILDQAGAESLLGQGDMLFKPLGTSRLQRVQGAFVTEEEIALVVEQCRAQRDQELDESLLEAPEATAEAGGAEGDFDPDEDPLLDKAIEIVVQTQTASVSLIQRRLRVGYTRAGRLIDMLERRGIISGYEGSKPRRVLVSDAEIERAQV